MPQRILEAYMTALPPLEAGASFLMAERIAVGTGALRESGRAAVLRRWRAETRTPASRPRTPAELAVVAASAGIGFKRVVRKQ